MEEQIKNDIEERMAELPEDIRAAILASDFEEKIRAIGAKQNLHVDQTGTLGDAAMLIMLGFSPHETFESTIAANLNVPLDKARELAADINTQIFLPIRESMKKFAGESDEVVRPPAFSAQAPVKAIEPHPADMMLTQKTVSIAPAAPKAIAPAPTTPQPYKADPYREVPE